MRRKTRISEDRSEEAERKLCPAGTMTLHSCEPRKDGEKPHDSRGESLGGAIIGFIAECIFEALLEMLFG